MSKKAKGIFAVIFSLIISLITVFMINEYLNTETQRRVEQASADTHSVVVFANDLTAGTIVLAKDLLVRQYPSHLINHNWFLLHVSDESEHSFRFNPITHFGLNRSPVSVLSDHF